MNWKNFWISDGQRGQVPIYSRNIWLGFLRDYPHINWREMRWIGAKFYGEPFFARYEDSDKLGIFLPVWAEQNNVDLKPEK